MKYRSERAAASLGDTLDFLAKADTPGLRHAANMIAELVSNTDIIGFSPYDSDVLTDDVVITVESSREDYGLLPASAYVFQALPQDKVSFPKALLEQRATYALVIEKHSIAVIEDNAIGDPHLTAVEDTRTEARPLIMFADCQHPLTQAIGGVDIYSRLSGQVHGDIPFGGKDEDDNAKIYRGLSQINAATMVCQLLKAEDSSGDVAHWIDTNISNFAGYVNGTHTAEDVAPPSQSLLAEAYAVEPIAKGLMRAYFITKGVVSFCKENDMSLAQAAHGVHLAVEKGFK